MGNANIRKHYTFSYGHHQLRLSPSGLLSKCTLQLSLWGDHKRTIGFHPPLMSIPRYVSATAQELKP